MSKKVITTCLITTLVVGLGVAAVGLLSKGFKDWNVDNWKNNIPSITLPNTSTDDPSIEDPSVSNPSVDQPSIVLSISGGPIFQSAQVGDYKEATATLLPSNVTNKTILWSTSDVTKIRLGSPKTLSGVPNTLTVEKEFSDEVTITLKAEALPSVTTSFNVKMEDVVKRASMYALFMGEGDSSIDKDDITLIDSANVEINKDSQGFLRYTSDSFHQKDRFCGFVKNSDEQMFGFICKVETENGYSMSADYYTKHDLLRLDRLFSLSTLATLPTSDLSKYVFVDLDPNGTSVTASSEETLFFGNDVYLDIAVDEYVAPAGFETVGDVTF